MRVLSDATRDAVNAEVNDGPTRYWWRATVEYGAMDWWTYDTENMPGLNYGNDRPRTGHYSSFMFGGWGVREVPNLLSGQITRSLDQDIAELQLTFLNTVISPMGDTEEEYADNPEYDVPGVMSFSRGNPTIETNRWGHTADTGWEDLLVPDRIMRTYEGYGIDTTVPPGLDDHMYASGIWLIDSVALNSEGDLVVKARDLARILEDHIAMPPDIPWDSYPLKWSKIDTAEVPGRAPTGGSWWEVTRRSGSSPVSATSSNQRYVGLGIEDTPTYISSHGNVLGHRDSDPIVPGDGYWLSTGQESNDSMVWWELDVPGGVDMSALKVQTKGGPFMVYVSLHDGTDWVGRRTIPYEVTTENVDLHDKIAFVHREKLVRSTETEIVLPRKYQGIKKIRLTFTRLRRSPGADVYPWRAGLKNIQVYRGSYGSLGFDSSGMVEVPVGNYADYTDVVKWICAWSGFWWPERDSQRNVRYGRLSGEVTYSYTGNDPVLARGRVWGSFQNTGTAGVADLTPDQFDKQPLLDAIQVVRDIVGFLFYVDECGGAIWRMPNLYSKGNYVTPSHLETEGRHPTYDTDNHETIDERHFLTEYSTTMDSTDIRERIGVANSDGKVGTVIKGYVPYHVGLRRIAIWTDEHFESNKECRVAADMIAAQQAFSFRKSVSTIKPNPAIQIDDQVRIYERVTNETYWHYVTGITSTFDASTGKGTYSVESHWLGERITDAWVVRVDQLDSFTQEFLNHLGAVG